MATTFRRIAIVTPVVVSLAGCVTLSTAVRHGANEYSSAMDDFADRALLSNVLRARDYAPLNFNDLSSITGAFSFSASPTATFPITFNKDAGGAPLAGTVTPGFQYTASPSLTLGTLNTQGFMMTMIQPISPTYVLSKWNAGYDPAMLLYLFIKSIRFCDDPLPSSGSAPSTPAACTDSLLPDQTHIVPPCPDTSTVAPRRVHRNNPDNPAEAEDFRKLISCLTGPGSVELHSVTILDPLGNSVPLGQTMTTQSLDTTKGKPQVGINSDYQFLSAVAGLNDGQLHVGNAPCPDATESPFAGLCKTRGDHSFPFAQFYRVYPGVVVMCVAPALDGRFNGHIITPIPRSEKEREALLPEPQNLLAAQDSIKHYDDALVTPQQVLRAYTDSAHVTEDSLAHATARADNTQLTTRLQGLNATRLSMARALDTLSRHKRAWSDYAANLSRGLEALQIRAIARSTAAPKPGGGGGQQQAGANPSGPSGGGGASGNSGGGNSGGAMPAVTLALQPNRVSAIVDNHSCTGDQIVLPPSTDEEFDVTSTGFAHVEWRSIAEVIEYLGALARHSTDSAGTWTTAEDTSHAQTLFKVASNPWGRIAVTYGGGSYSVGYGFGESVPPDAHNDHSLQALALLNELISLAKISGSLPVTQPVQVLP